MYPLDENDPFAARAFHDAMHDIFESEGCVEVAFGDDDIDWEWDGEAAATA